jgi:hypothetical protein
LFVWKTTGPGTCPDPKASTVGRAMLDLRHWAVPGKSRDFPVGKPTRFTLESHPFASQLRKGERLVIAAGGGAVEMTADQRRPTLTLHRATLRLPVVGPAADGEQRSGNATSLRFAAAPRARAERGCVSRRRFTIRLPRSLARAKVRVAARRARVVRSRGRLRARIDLRGTPRRQVVRVRITGTTRSGRRVALTRRYRTCTPRGAS